ncbi:SDR family oxidoreductase [Nitriliruptoraceae bacterium ZYF776]|nr:SDR family oxidoreductase [Profundirhabdus halotolerans]
MQLRDTTVVVTGAAGGIGRALATVFLDAGARVALVDRDRDTLERTADELGADGEVAAFAVDVRDRAALVELEGEVAAALGPAAVVCANAGTIRPGTTWGHGEEDWDEVLAVNLGGVVGLLRAFLPRMIARGRPAHVITIASVGGIVPAPGMVSYAASKHAAVGVTETLAVELAQAGHDHIGVTLVCPGGVATPFWRHARDHVGDRTTDDVVAHERFTAAAADDRDDQTSPEQLALLVRRAVEEGTFWVAPVQPALRDVVRARHRAIEDAVARTSDDLYPRTAGGGRP